MVTCLPTLKSNKTLNKLKHLFWTSTWQFVPGIHWLSLELWSMVHCTKLELPTLRPHDEDKLQVVSLVMVGSGDKLDLWELNWYWSMWISLCRNCFNFDGNSILWVLGFLTILSLICFSTASSLKSVLHHEWVSLNFIVFTFPGQRISIPTWWRNLIQLRTEKLIETNREVRGAAPHLAPERLLFSFWNSWSGEPKRSCSGATHLKSPN